MSEQEERAAGGREHSGDDDADRAEIGEAARRGMQRAGVHLVRAAVEVVAGLSAFLEEMQAAGVGQGERDGDEGSGPEHIEVE